MTKNGLHKIDEGGFGVEDLFSKPTAPLPPKRTAKEIIDECERPSRDFTIKI